MSMRKLLPACILFLTNQAGAMPPDPIGITSDAGNVLFRHSSHFSVACTTCHHTSPGIRIKRACRSCHTPESRMPRSSRDAFHDSCIGCHLVHGKAGRATGPARRCSGCHDSEE